QRNERGAADRHVQVSDLRRRRAARVGDRLRGIEAAVGQAEAMRLAVERSDMRPGRDGAGDRVIGDLERFLRLAMSAGRQLVFPKLEAGEEANAGVRLISRTEGRR